MKRWAAGFAIAFFLFHSPVFSKPILDTDIKKSASSKLSFDDKIVSGLDADWQTAPSPFAKQPGGFTLKVGNGRHGQIVFPAVLDAQNPIVIQIQKDKVQQSLASGGSYKAELVGKYLVYQGDSNSILYRYDADKQSLREFVYLKDASALVKDGDVIQWRFEGADLKLQGDGSVSLTQTINIKSEVRKVSNNHMAERISRFLAKQRGTPEKSGRQTRILFTIPKPEYIDGHGKTITQGIQYKVADAKLTLHLDPNAKLAYPLWVDPSLVFKANTHSDLIIAGEEGGWFGDTVSSAGDFNGDELDDVIVASSQHDNNGLTNSGSAYIFFGRNPSGQVNLQSHMDADVILNGQNANDFFGRSASSAGDFNGDGLDDIIVGANWASRNGLSHPGRAYIFFGRNPSSQLILSSDSDADIIISGQDVDDHLGGSVSSAGDFNGDGLNDVIVATPVNDNNGLTSSGSAYIFFGRSSTTQLNFIADVDADIILDGQSSGDLFGNSVSSAGDFNGDGLGDVIIAAIDDDNNGTDSGSAFIFFGRNSGGQISLRADADADIILDGPSIDIDSDFGGGVNSAGDFNGDGLDDIIINARLYDTNEPTWSGRAFIFLGRNSLSQIRLQANLDANVILQGEDDTGLFGQFSASAGDFNGDGLDDVIVGQGVGSTGVRSGSVRIFFGRESTTQITLRASTDVDIIIDGQNEEDLFGHTHGGLASTGDFNGDGLDDIVVGAIGIDNGGFNLGSAFIFFGKNTSFPIITLFGDNPATVEAGTTFLNFGFNAQDLVDGDLTSSVVVGPFDINTLGTQTITYDVTNSRGNTAHAERTVTVVENLAPVITILGDNPVNVQWGVPYVDAGATALDNLDGDLTPYIFADFFSVDTYTLGTYLVTYSVWDSSGNIGTAERTVNVVENAPPIITIWGDNPVTVEAGDPYYDEGAAAVDGFNNSISFLIVTGGLPIDTSIPGSHIVTYDITDFGGTDHEERVVNVVDTTPPVVTPPADVTVSSTETETAVNISSATATDLVSVITLTNDAPALFPVGTTVVTWTATDSSGNTGTATQNVTIVLILPVITSPEDVLVDSTGALTTVNIGTATATDDIGIASITNDAPAQFPQGITMVTWTATNTSGNTATAIQSVRVQQPLLPIAQWDGQNAFASLGRAFASAGDFNGDGFEDIIVGDPSDKNQEGIASGRAFIYFGPNGPSPVDPNPEVDADIILEGQDSGDNFGVSPASIGDFNGDGIDDIIVGALLDDANGITNSGSAFIFFGRNTTGPLNLRADADADIILQGHIPNEFLGLGASPAGDFNGDGLDDIIVGAINNSNNGLHHSGSAYILFGRDTTSQLVLLAHTDADVTLDGQNTLDVFGDSVASAGDFNGDGLGDVIVGAPWDDNNGKSTSGSAFIFFGRNTTGPLNLRADADADIILNGSLDNSFLGDHVAFAGDFNGDGLDDVIIGAHSELPSSGSAFILFGRSITSQLILQANIDADLIIDGQGEDDRFGNAVASAGDFNGDGFDDVIVGARLDDNNEKSASGSAFIFFGRNTTGQLNLRADVDADFVFNGGNTGDQLSIVASAGDFDGDGIDDVFAGAGGARNNGLISSGSAFIYLGSNPVAPIITVQGDNPVILDVGAPYIDAGANASDIEDGDITASMLVSGLPVNTSILGSHVVTYRVTDSSGNSAQAVRMVNVVDTMAPVITLLGTTPMTMEFGSTYTDAGAIASDNVDGDLTASIVVGGLPINTSVLGAYTVTYDVTDSSGNAATQVTRTVNVVDTTPPVVTAPADIGPVEATGATTSVAIGTATATDNVAVASITNNAPAAFPLGLTVVTWTATDTSGNTGTVTQNVTVQDTTSPAVTAPADIGPVEATGATTSVAIGTATATDNVAVASITNNAPAAFPFGLTVVTWTATDTSGNAGTATQNVTVQDTTPPTLTINGNNPVTVEGGSTYVDAGATALDNVDGDLTASIIVGGLPINTNILGTHTVTYNVSDASGNAATQATRTVNVVDTTSPVVTPPADVTVDQTGDLTSVTIGTATATDNIGITSITNDAPASFPLGTTVVTWTATDTSGNTSSATQQVTVNPVPLVQLQLLKDHLNSLDLSTGLDKKLDKNLNEAEAAIAGGDNAGAIQDLQSFISTVQSNTPRFITQSDADEMIQRAQAIIALL